MTDNMIEIIKEYNDIGMGIAIAVNKQRETLSELAVLLKRLAEVNERTLELLDKKIGYENN